jgi:hypothetical protein
MLDPETPLASPEDIRIPTCLDSADEAIEVVRGLHDAWLKQRAAAVDSPGA